MNNAINLNDIIIFKLIKSIISSLMDTKIRIRQKTPWRVAPPIAWPPVALIMLCAASAPALRCFRTSAWQKGFHSQPKKPLRSCLKNNPPRSHLWGLKLLFKVSLAKFKILVGVAIGLIWREGGKMLLDFFGGDFYGLGSLFFPKIHRTEQLPRHASCTRSFSMFLNELKLFILPGTNPIFSKKKTFFRSLESMKTRFLRPSEEDSSTKEISTQHRKLHFIILITLRQKNNKHKN